MKKLACLILSLLMLICTIGCNAKSTEMTLNDGILENDYFSIDVSGYDTVKYTMEDLQSDELIGGAYAMSYTNANGGTSSKQYIQIYGYEGKRAVHIPNKSYFEAHAISLGRQLLSYENINNDPNLGAIVEYLYPEDGLYYYTATIMLKAGDLWFTIDMGDRDGTEERFEGYTTAIDSFKLK